MNILKSIDEELTLLTELYGSYLRVRCHSSVAEDDETLPWEQIVTKRLSLDVPVLDIFETLVAESSMDINVHRVGQRDEFDMQDVEITCTCDKSDKVDALLKKAIVKHTNS